MALPSIFTVGQSALVWCAIFAASCGCGVFERSSMRPAYGSATMSIAPRSGSSGMRSAGDRGRDVHAERTFVVGGGEREQQCERV